MGEATLGGNAAETREAIAERFGISPLELLRSLQRAWLFIVICGAVLGAAGYAYTVSSIPKRYTTSATISVQQPQVAIPALQGALSGDSMSDPMPLVRSEVQILTSRALIQKVANRLHLDQDPEFNSTLRPLAGMELFKQKISAALPTAIADPLISLGLLPDASQVPSKPAESVIQEGVVGAVLGRLSVLNDNRSLIIVVQFTALEPDTAAKIINTLLDEYVQDRVQGRASVNQNANSELTQRVNSMRAEIEALEAKITGVREKYNLVQTRAGSVGQQQLEDLSGALTRASSERAQAVANYQRAVILAKNGGATGDDTTVMASSAITSLRDHESTVQRRIAELSTTQGPGYPQLIAARAELASVRAALAAEARRVVTSLGAQADVATAREAEIKRQLEVSQRDAGGLAAVQSELAQLEKDADSRRSIYQTLLQGEAQTAAKIGTVNDTSVRVVSSAVPPAYPSGPKPKMAGVLGLISGCAIGSFLVLVRDRRDRGFLTADAIAQSLQITPLQVLTRRRGRHFFARRVLADASGPEAVALRSLRTRLRFQGRTGAPRSILFVSSVVGEDSADVAAAFARVSAIDGLRVLLLEGDLQTPSLAPHLGVPASNGLVDALQEGNLWQEHVGHDDATKLDTLLVATTPWNAPQLLDSMQLQNLVAEARDSYNLIVMTAHAMGSGTHTMVVANLVDMVVLVVGAKKARRENVRQSVQTLSSTVKKRPVVVFTQGG